MIIMILLWITITSWLAPSLVAFPWTVYIPLLSVILMYTGGNSFEEQNPHVHCTQVIILSKNKIIKTLLLGFGLGYGPIVFMLQGGYCVCPFIRESL